MKERALAFGRAFLNLIYPIYCIHCGRKMERNTGLCPECVAGIQMNSSGIAACRYEGAIKKAIHSLKYKGFTPLARVLSSLLADFAGKAVNMRDIDVIIPVPLHPAGLRQRGFNQSRLLCEGISGRYLIPVREKCVQRIRHTRPQSGLNRQKRLLNMRGAFRVKDTVSIKGKNVLLVDDVYTTGSTISNASGALKRSGAAEVRAVALAHGN